MQRGDPPQAAITLRTDIRPGDIGTITAMHGFLYAREYGFDATFEAYVAGPLSEFVRAGNERERIWIAERDGSIVGAVAIVAATDGMAQLRWFLVDPAVRGAGLGRRLLEEAVAFARDQGYSGIILWTVSALRAAAHLYTSVGFRKMESIAARLWGTDVVEERYDMSLR
ncbi:MAG TPA: GNAT family N-acetyltransferase [Candidatus Kapabacteria bacterium]|nr:GNAT family N-acetyltransferase [Candidatus Kapabacteria bacterium]